jgi:hypothetical protein
MSASVIPTAPSRRSALRFGLAATFAGFTTSAIAAADPDADAALIAFCDECVRMFQEAGAIADFDPWAPDKGPHHDRYTALWDGACSRVDDIAAHLRPTTIAGLAAVARVALQVEVRDRHGALDPSYPWQKLPLIVLLAATGRGDEPILTRDEKRAIKPDEPAEEPEEPEEPPQEEVTDEPMTREQAEKMLAIATRWRDVAEEARREAVDRLAAFGVAA